MDRQRWTSEWRRLLAPAAGVVAMLAGMLPANADARP
jgi:hypothetical protein